MQNLILTYPPYYIMLLITLFLTLIIAALSIYAMEKLPFCITMGDFTKDVAAASAPFTPLKFAGIKTSRVFKFGFTLTPLLILSSTALKTTSFLQYGAYLIFISAILNLIVIDYKTMLLPDEITIPLIWLGLLFNSHGLISSSLQSSVYGAILGYLLLWSVYWGFKLITKKEGMGYGDFKLLAAILAFLGIEYLIPTLLLSSCLGIIYYIAMTLYNKYSKNPIEFKDAGAIPFGPYLGISAIVLLLFGNSILGALIT